MRVDYTLPALQPGSLPELPEGQESELSFHAQLRNLTVQLPVTWEQQLRLDVRPFSGTYIGQPPRPPTLELHDPETQRSRWRNMLWRHGPGPNEPGRESSVGRGQPVQTMLEMLLDMQEMEDSILSQSVSVTRG
jgi:hypothetical protein